MRRLSATLISASLVAGLAAAGCSGETSADPAPTVESTAPSSGVETPVEPTPTPNVLQLADVCPMIQDALDEAFGEGQNDWANFEKFGMLIADLIPQTDPKGQNLLESLSEVTLTTAGEMEVGDALEAIDARRLWFNEMDRVTEVCQELGAPLK